ncbi:hypothetical protein BDV97DRAFT_305598 [Delphinella strobiligena]|nr:hypothetical protein BDV97DRAFT_305598 [Delphinella strobiligena]
MQHRISAPPAVILYEIDGSDDAALQQDQLLLTSLSARYLPLLESSRASRAKKSPSVPRYYTIHPDHKARIYSQRAGVSRARWIPGEVPVELFEAVTQYLSRDDIKSMRLVNREFERGVSRALFNTVVVPFNTELYDMIEQDKGHGLRVFEGFGSHIRRFGMSFEVKEDALRNPPQKKALDQLDSYFGSYKWPSTEYTRFGELAGLERTADETSQMKLAFSHLHKVQHLALCLDSGLGWISGPDKSMRTQILQRASPIFGGCSHDDELELFDAVPTSEQAGYGPLRTTDTDVRTRPKLHFTPAILDKHQKEWLLEAEWAQRAFLMSYMLAVVDNAAIFSKVTVLNLARISSRLVPLFYRHDFWNALPALGDITVCVIPDWRTVEKDEAGFVETREIEPSKAHEGLYSLLKDYIGPKSSIKKIKFGWAAGGENAEGCFARNNHILPAPITFLPRTVQSFQDDQAMLHLPHVEHLTLSNCWISPPALINLVKNLESASLKKMSLESVSLTAHPRFPVVNGVHPNAALANVPFNQQWYEGHRDGSWATVVNALSPGPTLAMYQPRDEFAPIPTKRETGLAELELISCGYAALHNAPFDQTVLETPHGERDRKQHFQRRRVLLQGAMLCSTDRYLGHIVQFIPEREQDALRFAWNMTMGWADERKAAESEYDGFLPGGTGRFSGIVTKNMDLGAAATHTG